MLNREKPQFRQTSSLGNNQKPGLSKFASPGKWASISAVNSACLTDWHERHVIKHPRSINFTGAGTHTQLLFAITYKRKKTSVCSKLHTLPKMPYPLLPGTKSNDRRLGGPTADAGLFVEDNTQKRSVHPQSAVIVNEAELSEFVHEKIHA